MADLGELVARLRIDTSGLNTGAASATNQLSALGTVAVKAGDDAENAGRRVSASGAHYVTLGTVVSRAMQELSEWFARLSAASNPLISGLGNLGSAVTKMAQNMGTGAAAATAALVAGLAALTIVVIKGVKDFADLGSSVREFQRFTGTGAEEASKLVFALERLGVGSDTGAQAMGRLNLQVARQPERFAALGIAVNDSNGQLLSSTQILYNVADAYVATESPQQKALIASTAFGTSWRSMVPILAQGSAGIRKLGDDAERFGLVLSEGDVKASREFSASLKELEAAGRGFGIVMARELVPHLTNFVQGATTAVAGASTLADAVGGAGFVFEVAAGAISPLVGGLLAIGKDQRDAASAANELSAQMLLEAAAVGLTAQEIEGLTNATAPAVIQQKALANSVNLMKTELDLATQGYDRHIAGTIGLRNAELGVADALANLRDSFSGGKDAALDLRDAQLSLQEALLGQRQAAANAAASSLELRSAQLSVAQAGISVRDAMRDQQRTTIEVSGAMDRVRSAALSLRSSQLSLTDAMADQAKVAIDLANIQDTLASAALDVREAQLDLADAIARQQEVYAEASSSAMDKARADIAVERATINLNQAMANQQKTAIDVANAQNDLEKAAIKVEAAQIAVRDASRGQSLAMIDLAGSGDKLTAASLNVQQAQLALAEALVNQRAVYADASSSALDKERADLAVARAQAALRDAMDATSTSMDISTEAGRRNRAAFADAAQAILDHMQALIDSGAPAETIRAAWDADTAALNAQMHQAGFTAEQIAALNREYGLVPETVNTAINIAMDTQKIALLQIVSQNMGQLDGATAQVILDQIGAGDTAAAIETVTEALRDLADYQAALGAGFTFPPGSIIHVPKPIDEVPGQPHAMGALITKPELALVGEAGPELILPLTKPSRMAALLNQYGGAVPMAEGGLMGGTPVNSSTNNWMQGATIIVQASDPAELERKLEQRARLSRMSGAR